jgi:hypothetical protein
MMAKNFKGDWACLQCIFENVDKEVTPAKRCKLEAKLWTKDEKSVYKDYSRDEFTNLPTEKGRF